MLVKASFEDELQKPMVLCLLLALFVLLLSFNHVYFVLVFFTFVCLTITMVALEKLVRLIDTAAV